MIIMLMGEYHHSIDEKKRLTMPSKIRYELQDGCIITRGLDKCLAIYSKQEWENIIKKYKDLPQNKNVRNFMRIFLSGATILEFDKQGRINIPNILADFAELKKDCVIIGVNDRLEIWSEDNWNKFIQENEENFSEIADELFSADINI